MEREQKGLIQAALRNSCGLDISGSAFCLLMAIMAAAYINVDVEDGDPVLLLTYDYKKFI